MVPIILSFFNNDINSNNLKSVSLIFFLSLLSECMEGNCHFSVCLASSGIRFHLIVLVTFIKNVVHRINKNLRILIKKLFTKLEDFEDIQE